MAWTLAALGGAIAVQAMVSASDWNFTLAKTIAGHQLGHRARGHAAPRSPRRLPRDGAQRSTAAMAPFAACLLILGGQQFTWSGLLAGQ